MKTTMSLKVDTSMVHKIQDFCWENRIKRSDFLNDALQMKLEKEGLVDKPKSEPRQIKSKIEKK